MKLPWIAVCLFCATAPAAAQDDTAPSQAVVETPVPETQLSSSDLAFNEAVQAVRDKNFRRAIELFLPLAEDGAADAQFNLAVLLRLGRGRPQNFGEAYFWAAMSALGGEERALELVDELNGILPEKERETIVKSLTDRLTKQIESGDDGAPEKLARVHADFAVTPDLESAFIWFSICHALGKPECQDGMDRVAEDMPAETIVKLQAQAAEVFEQSAFSRP